MSVQSIERAFSVLRALATGPLGVTELADQIGLPKSTVSRLLSALETEGAVIQVESGGDYRLGEGLLDIAGAAQPGRNLVATVRPYLLALAEELNESAGLSIIDGRYVYYLDHAETEADVMVRDWTGESLPIHSVPSGIALMAHWSPEQLTDYLAEPLEQVTARTLTAPDLLQERIEQFRRDGYVWGYEEGVDGINSVATVVLDHNRQPVAALHIHGPAYRFPDRLNTEALGRQLVTTAESIASQL
jgi:IclR family acetate operon transcriptional repressor